MIIHSKYTKIFQSKDLTRQKYDELYNFAVLIQNHKNIVSKHVNENLLHYLDCTKFQFAKEMRTKFKVMYQVHFMSKFIHNYSLAIRINLRIYNVILFLKYLYSKVLNIINVTQRRIKKVT